MNALERFQYGCTGVSWMFKDPLPIGIGKITIFDGVASASQIDEAAG